MPLKFQVCVPIAFTLEMIFSLFSSTKFIGIASIFISNYHYLFLLFNFPLIEKFPGDLHLIKFNTLSFMHILEL